MQFVIGSDLKGRPVEVGKQELAEGIMISGRYSDHIACNVIINWIKEGNNAIVVDYSSSAENVISGYVKTYDFSYFLPDIMKLGKERAEIQIESLSSMLSEILLLPENQALMLYSALNLIAAEDGYFTPSSIYDSIQVIDGFKSTEKQELSGKVSSLGRFDFVPTDNSIEDVMNSPSVIALGIEGSVKRSFFFALLVSKILACLYDRSSTLFAILTGKSITAFDSSISRKFIEYYSGASFAKLISAVRTKELCYLPYCIVDSNSLHGCYCLLYSGQKISDEFYALLPKEFKGHVITSLAKKEENSKLRYEVLNLIQSNESATKQSISLWLSPDYGSEKVLYEIESIISDGLAIVYKKDEKSIPTLKLTELGKIELKRFKQEWKE